MTPPNPAALRLLLCALILAGAIGFHTHADAHGPEDTGGLHLSFGDQRIAWPTWAPGATASELWREHGARLRATGVRALWLWDGSRWLGYAADAGGRNLPGAADFELSTSSRLYYSGGAVSAQIDPAAIQEGELAGILHDRNLLGHPQAPVLIIDYSDFL